ncbi:hypothetical protein [Robertmurraya massiliosenegalensis]|uniref:hypothetical protein n=1 Tax=Robertmurraya massiliosenegalensis TaxID=1287657 RepID=UPI0002D4C43B|nr:hypothetical protein [Robertmurraya massiliosenegalensis]
MIYETLYKYHELSIKDSNHRFKSWEHCYNFFSQNYHNLKDEKILDQASLHLAFYLASWGMLRGSSFLLQKDYKVHLHFLKKIVLNPSYFHYFDKSQPFDYDYSADINNLINESKKAYQDNIHEINGEPSIVNVTDTLASKILLGVYGNVPAYDRYFKEALSLFEIRTQFNESSLQELIDFYNQNIEEFEKCKKLFSNDGVHYTPMKLLDMFFWQIGFMMDNLSMHLDALKSINDFAIQYKSSKKIEITSNISYRPINSNGRIVVGKGLTEEIRKYVISKLSIARDSGEDYIDLRSGDIHKEMGLRDRLPSVCGAMESLGVFRFTIIRDTPSGKSSTRVVRYFLKG